VLFKSLAVPRAGLGSDQTIGDHLQRGVQLGEWRELPITARRLRSSRGVFQLKRQTRRDRVVQTPKPSLSSFARESYFGVTAMRFINKDGVSRHRRYRIIPEAGPFRRISRARISALACLRIRHLGRQRGKSPSYYKWFPASYLMLSNKTPRFRCWPLLSKLPQLLFVHV
jgi:hypothetical protein